MMPRRLRGNAGRRRYIRYQGREVIGEHWNQALKGKKTDHGFLLDIRGPEMSFALTRVCEKTGMEPS